MGDCNPVGDPNECKCHTTCGNDFAEIGEACDGTDDSECPGACVACECPDPICGNNIVESALDEECDGTATTDQGAICDPEDCRPPGDPAGQCKCSCGGTKGPPPAIEAPPVDPWGSHIDKNRYISMVVPVSGAPTAIRVKLTSLHHPVEPEEHPDFTPWQGEFRWVNSLNATHTCLDSPNFPGSTFRCAILGCNPEYRDWGAELDGAVMHVTGAAVVPSSQYDAAHVGANCSGQEASCAAISADLPIFTAQFGDTDPYSDGLSVLDIARIVDHIKGATYPTVWPAPPGTGMFKPRVHLRPNVPDAASENVGVLDVASCVDAVKGNAYWHFGAFGPCTDACGGEAACP